MKTLLIKKPLTARAAGIEEELDFVRRRIAELEKSVSSGKTEE